MIELSIIIFIFVIIPLLNMGMEWIKEKTMQYTVSQDQKTGQWYCHMKGFPYIPCFGSFCERKSEAYEYAKMWSGLPHNVKKKKREST